MIKIPMKEILRDEYKSWEVKEQFASMLTSDQSKLVKMIMNYKPMENKTRWEVHTIQILDSSHATLVNEFDDFESALKGFYKKVTL